LRSISPEIFAAAALDGASRVQQFRHITWPLIWPVTALVLTIQLILQLKIFDQVFLLTGGGPFNSTYVVVQYIYRQAFTLNHGGYGATVALFLLVIIAVLSVLQYQVLRTRTTA
jgi:multiple sugar transport system permease protein